MRFTPVHLQLRVQLLRRLGLFSVGVWVSFLLALFAAPAQAEKPEQLKPSGYVNDFAGVMSTPARERLTALCAEVDQKARAQIAVVTIRSLEGAPIEDFAVNLATRWGIGPKAGDRGVLLLLAVGDRRYRVDVGYGLEPILPDGKVGGFTREIVPLLRQNDYSGALLQLTSRIAEVIAQDRGVTLGHAAPRRAVPREAVRTPSLFVLIPLVVFLVFTFLLSIVGGMFRSTGRRRGGWPGGWWMLGGMGGGGNWGGGGFGGGGGGGGGFGGFGGGSFGGGGASGSW